MTEIISGIYQLKVPIPNNPLECTNVYLLQGNDGYLMIDTGWNSERAFESLKEQLAEIGINLGDISQIVVTHAHADHYGLVGRLKQHSKARVSLHYLEEKLLTFRFGDMNEFRLRTEQWFHSNGVPDDTFPTSRITPTERRRFNNPVMPDSTLRGEETISTGIFNLEVLWTPGHSPGHICLYEKNQKILFSGDHVLPAITPNISLQPQSEDNPLGDFLTALNALKRLDVSLVLPGHEHLFTNLQTRVDEIIRHHEQRNSEIVETLKSEPKTAYQISDGITWMPDFGGYSFMDLAPWERRMAVLETLAHLKAMETEGKVEKFSKNGIIYYNYNHL
jgi:glyoxylase-like metal-dependent hydrolase (beta-lactamase superfamily II)